MRIFTEYFLFVHHTTCILAKLSTWCLELSGEISYFLLFNPSHTDQSWEGQNTCMWIYIYISISLIHIYIYIYMWMCMWIYISLYIYIYIYIYISPLDLKLSLKLLNHIELLNCMFVRDKLTAKLKFLHLKVH